MDKVKYIRVRVPFYPFAHRALRAVPARRNREIPSLEGPGCGRSLECYHSTYCSYLDSGSVRCFTRSSRYPVLPEIRSVVKRIPPSSPPLVLVMKEGTTFPCLGIQHCCVAVAIDSYLFHALLLMTLLYCSESDGMRIVRYVLQSFCFALGFTPCHSGRWKNPCWIWSWTSCDRTRNFPSCVF